MSKQNALNMRSGKGMKWFLWFRPTLLKQFFSGDSNNFSSGYH